MPKIKLTCFREEHEVELWFVLPANWTFLSWYQVLGNLSTSIYSSFHIFEALQVQTHPQHQPPKEKKKWVKIITRYNDKYSSLWKLITSPAFAGKARQLPWPCCSMKAKSFWSSSGVHGPFFKPTFSQHGDLPIFPESQYVKIMLGMNL